MADSAWSIRFFHANNYKEDGNIDFVSNFKKGKNRQLDTIRTYSGMYGIDNYLIWDIHKDLPNYDFSTVALNLNLCLYRNPEIVYFQDFYRVQDIRYNPNKSRYTLYAISETTVKLHAKLIDYNVTSLSYKENRKASDIIREIIEDNNIFYVIYHEDDETTKGMIDYEYRYFDIDPEWTVLDFIEYICNDNMYEWCIDKFIDKDNIPTEILHFGHEIKPWGFRDATKKFELERDNISQSIFTMKITTDGSPMEPLAHWEERLRCIWSKHVAGKTGGISRGCFIPIGQGHFDKSLYLKSLEGNIERDIGYSRLSMTKRNVPSVKIGNIIQDEGDPQFIDIISVQKNPDLYPIREPHNILIDRGDDIAVQHQKEHITRSTPYLDDEAGLIFPSSKLENSPPNSIIFNIDGKAESSVAGPFIMGDGRIERDEEGKPTGEKTLKLPFKNKKEDFRLRFPDGAEMYYDSTAQVWFFQSSKGFAFKEATITDYDKIPEKTRLAETENMLQIYQGNLMWDSRTLHMHLMDGGCFQVVPKTGPQPSDPHRRFALYCDNETGEIIIEAKDDIDIVIKYQGALSSGTINIDTTGTVNIGNGAAGVNLAGGSKAFPLKDHTHPIACKPGPPRNTDKSIDDNTTKTKAT